MAFFHNYSDLFSVICGTEPPSRLPSSSFCWANSSSSFSVADCGTSIGLDSAGDGNFAILRLGSLCVNGVHGPWMDGHSVCPNLRKRISLVLPFCVSSKLTHLETSSSPRHPISNQWRSPFTGWAIDKRNNEFNLSMKRPEDSLQCYGLTLTIFSHQNWSFVSSWFHVYHHTGVFFGEAQQTTFEEVSVIGQYFGWLSVTSRIRQLSISPLTVFPCWSHDFCKTW